jgi:hypothetical protein
MPDPTILVGPNAVSATTHDDLSGANYSITYSTFAWAKVTIGAPGSLLISAADKSEQAAISLSLDGTGNITSPPMSGATHFTDTNSAALPSGSIVFQLATATDSQGAPIVLTPAQISALESAFTIAPAPGNTNNGAIDWTYNPDGTALNFLTGGERATVVSTIQVADQNGNIDTGTVSVVLAGARGLFTTGVDDVNFNFLMPAQQTAIIQSGPNVTNTYNGLGGNDVVTLPDASNYNVSLGIGTPYTLGWTDLTQFYTGSITGDVYTVYGGTGTYNIHLGAGTDNVSISGSNLLGANGNNNIYGGAGNNNISIIGNGNNTIAEGAGNSVVSLVGNGVNTITMNAGTVTANLTGTNELDVTFTGNNQDLILNNISGFSLSGKIVITGFNTTDRIDFANQMGLETGVQYSQLKTLNANDLSTLTADNFSSRTGELDVFSLNTPSTSPRVARLFFGASNPIVKDLEPINDNGGTEIKADISQQGYAPPTNSGSVNWNFILKQEGGIRLTAYVPPGSGVTVGGGVDLETGDVFPGSASQNTLGSILKPDLDYTTDANLTFLNSVTKAGLRGSAAANEIAMNPVSITTSQANLITNFAERAGSANSDSSLSGFSA